MDLFDTMKFRENKNIFKGLQNQFLILSFALLFIISAAYPVVRPSLASAQGETYILYYPKDEQIKQTLKKLYDDGEKIDDKNRQYVSILASGGTLFGDEPQRMVYDIDVNKQMSDRGGGADNDSDEQFFSKVYYCNQATGDRSWTTPSGTSKYYRITYAIGMKVSDADELFNTKIHKDVWVGATKIQLITPATPGPDGQPGEEQNTETIKELKDSDGPGELGDDIDKITNAKCRPSPVGGPSKIQVKNYYSATSEAEKQKVQGLLAAANSGSNGSGSNLNGDNQPNCENTGNAMSFVVCPFIDGIANTSDWIFDSVVEPLLKNVPVGTAPDDPGYKAWQGFRIIGNVFLIGALLSVVYYQAKGGN